MYWRFVSAVAAVSIKPGCPYMSAPYSGVTVKTIVVQCALPKEAERFVQVLEDPDQSDRYGIHIVSGDYRDMRLVVCVGGMGKVAAGATAQMAIMEFHPDALIFSGIAGGLNPRLGIGDVVIAHRLEYLETNTSIIAECAPYMPYFQSDPDLVKAAERALRNMGYSWVPSLSESGEHTGGASDARVHDEHRYVCGTIATSDQFNTDPHVLRRIMDDVHADCEEMEGAAAAHVSARCGIPFCAVRAISNRCGESYASVSDHEQDLLDAARIAASVCLRMLDMLT